MKIAIGSTVDWRKGNRVITYYDSWISAFEVDRNVKRCDIIFEIECGKNTKGELNWLVPKTHQLTSTKIAYFIDSHTRGADHKAISPHYDHVFFAPWVARDFFSQHKSAHWLPNATDLNWFGRDSFHIKHVQDQVDFTFIGSKMGLHRADPMVEVCKRRSYSYLVKEVAKAHRVKWPATGIAMREGRNQFNWGQKVDGPNLRVMETMAVGRPLITDKDPEQRDGMNKLFKEGEHLVYYNRYSFEDLEEKMKWLMNNPSEAAVIANNAYNLVKRNHLIINRAQTIIETVTK